MQLIYNILFLVIHLNSSHKEEHVLLRITPLDTTAQTTLATKELITFFHSLALPHKSFLNKLLRRKKTYALELVATKEQGICYIMRIPAQDVVSVKKSLYSYLPGLQIQEISDYLPITKSNVISTNKWWGFQEMKLSNHFAFPLSSQAQLTQHDPIAYLTGNMTKLKPNEIVVMQLLISPVTKQSHGTIVKDIHNLLACIEEESDITLALIKRDFRYICISYVLLPLRLIKFLIYLFLDITIFPISLFFFLITIGKTRLFPFLFPAVNRPHLKLTAQQQTLYQDMGRKIGEELFETSVRFFTVVDTENDLHTRMDGLSASLATFSSSYQSFTTRKHHRILGKMINTINLFCLQNRHLALHDNPILSVSEVANLYHFPYTDTTKTEGLQKIKSKTLPLPIAINNNINNFSCTFGNNSYGDEQSHIRLSKEERRRHVYMLGATGTGKSTLLRTMVHSDLLSGNGLCVIDPHGDLIEKILGDIPEERIKDVVLFNPNDIQHPMGLNLLELPKNLPLSELQKEKDLIASSMLSIFSKLYPPQYTGPRMEYVLRNAILTVLETEKPTLFSVQRLLVDYSYRKNILPLLKDPVLQLFWKKEFSQFGSYQKAAVVSPITNKVGRFITSPHSRYILGQAESKIDFSAIMNEGKILLCDLSKGKIGEDTSSFFGALITAKIQLAALRRVRIPEEERKDFSLYIDEFQNFATSSFAQILSEARKYHLNAILAHQTIAQIDDISLVKVILANTGTMITFRTGSPFDEEFILPHFIPQLGKGDIANLPNYHFYMKINALESHDAFSGKSIAITTPPNEAVKEKIKKYSRDQYTTPMEQVEQEIVANFVN